MARLLVFNALISSECAAHCPDFINKDAWPPNSPDLNPLDYHVWGSMLDKFNLLNPQPKNIPRLKTALLVTWDELPREAIRISIVSFRKSLVSMQKTYCVHFEYKL